jgi:hypothetical protein
VSNKKTGRQTFGAFSHSKAPSYGYSSLNRLAIAKVTKHSITHGYNALQDTIEDKTTIHTKTTPSRLVGDLKDK